MRNLGDSDKAHRNLPLSSDKVDGGEKVHQIRISQNHWTTMALQLILPIWLPTMLLLCLVYLIYKKSSASAIQKWRLPPGPRRLPVIGNLHQLGEIPHRSLGKLSEKYGPVIFLQLGGVPTVVVSSPEAAKQVLKVHDLASCSRPALAGPRRLSYDFRDIGFSPFGDYWRETRKLCVLELFNPKRLQSFQYIYEEEVASMIDSISRSCSSSPGRSVDLSEQLLSQLANIICRMAFGKSLQGSSRLKEVIHETSAMLGSFCAADLFPYVGWIVDRLTGFSARLERNFRDLDDIYQKAIDEHLEGGSRKSGQQDFLDVLLKIEREQADSGGGQFTRDHTKGILMDVFVGGIDPPLVTLVWAMSELMKNPRAMKKAKEEVRTLIGNKGKVSEADLEHLDYLKLVVKETTRLHPAGPLLIPRETISLFEINGYQVLPKTRLYVNAWAIGRDPNSWNDPEKFVPERFEGSGIEFKGQQHFELLPFGGGRRGCPGMNMGLGMVNLALANLLYHFDWKLPNGMKEENLSMEEKFGITLIRKAPLNVVPTKYHPPS